MGLEGNGLLKLPQHGVGPPSLLDSLIERKKLMIKEVYYKEQADRMAQQEGRATPAASVASTSRNGAERGESIRDIRGV